jgi:hypothetical protein
VTTTSRIRELSVQETQAVAGGPLPLVGVVLNLAARVVVNQLARHFIRNAGLVASTYSAGVEFSKD